APARLFPRPDRLVVCPAYPRQQLLDAACLAGAEGVPLWVIPPKVDAAAMLRPLLSEWKTTHVTLVGEAGLPVLLRLHLTKLPQAADVRSAYVNKLGPNVERAVVTNPTDLEKGMGGMSALAPWLAVRRKAALLFTGAKGTDAADVVREAAQRPGLAHLDT